MLAIDHFERGRIRFPQRVAVADDAISLTYSQLGDFVDRVAGRLIENGVREDDPVAVVSPNHPFLTVCQFGIIRAGALWTPCSYRNVARDNARQLAAYGTKWLFLHSSLADQIDLLREHVPSLLGIVCIDREVAGATSMEAWARQDHHAPAFPQRAMSQAVAILSTSGTTGEPKGAIVSNLGWEAMIASFYSELAFDTPPVHLVVSPMSHAAGMLQTSLMPRGATNIVLGSTDPADVLAAIEHYRASILFLPPTLIYMMLAHPDLSKYDYSSLRYLYYGAAPMSVQKLREACAAFGDVMCQGYGQTEAIMMMTIMTPKEHKEILENEALATRAASAGRPGPLSRIAIMDEEGNLLPPHSRGEIVCRSQLVMSGYFNNVSATAEVSAFGWHHTGDIGYLDEDDYVYIVDRKRDLIISGGFNIFPGEVEQAALAHPSIQDCVVIGAPHEKWGEVVTAVVEVKPGRELVAEEFLAFCKATLGSTKAPKQVHIWETLPRSNVGKTLRRVVRESFWASADRKL